MFIHLAELSKRLKTRASQMPIYLWVVFFYLIKYVHYYKELELTMSKLYSYFKLENVEIVSETVATVCFLSLYIPQRYKIY